MSPAVSEGHPAPFLVKLRSVTLRWVVEKGSQTGRGRGVEYRILVREEGEGGKEAEKTVAHFRWSEDDQIRLNLGWFLRNVFIFLRSYFKISEL